MSPAESAAFYAPKHTPGPWRWEVNLKHKQVQLCGGKPRYDMTVMGFTRFGMGGAAPKFQTNGILRRADEHSVVVPGREHHADWFRDLSHPDARLIAAAPDLLALAHRFLAFAKSGASFSYPLGSLQELEAAIAKATGA